MRRLSMIRIGRHPVLGAIPLIAGVSVFGSLALAVPLSGLYGAFGAGAWSYALAFITLLIVLGGGISVGLAIAYGTVEWDQKRRVARLRGREVPLHSITELWRSMSSSGTATYLTYRFVSEDGASVRVLVAGRPMRGLDPDGLRSLADFVAALPAGAGAGAGNGDADAASAVGTSELTEHQRAAAVTITDGGGKSRATPAVLLAELATFIDPQSATGASASPPTGAKGADARTPQAGTISPEEAERIEAEWAEADAAALAEFVADKPLPRRLRRLLFWLTLLTLLVAAGAIAFAVIAETAGGGSIDSDTNDVISGLVISCMLFGALFYLAWCAAADADVRGRRRLAERAWDSLDASERHLGIPTPLLAAWTEPALRLRQGLAFAASIVGLFAVLFGIIVLIEPESIPIAFAVIGIAVGAALATWSVFAFIAVHRRKRVDAERFVLLAGWRLLPPTVRES